MTDGLDDVDRMVDVAANLERVSARIQDISEAADRSAEEVVLVAVSKGHGADKALAALRAGHRVFGENRVNEAENKWPPFKAEYPDIQLHLIGPLQTNKARRAVALFDVLQTIDSVKLARVLAKEMDRVGKILPCFIQVNTGEEPQKSGVPPREADVLISQCVGEIGLNVVGLMCIPPVHEEPALHFSLLADIAQRHGLGSLSMGMSADYDVALRFGATHVRIGTAIFGDRPA